MNRIRFAWFRSDQGHSRQPFPAEVNSVGAGEGILWGGMLKQNHRATEVNSVGAARLETPIQRKVGEGEAAGGAEQNS